MLFRIDTNDPRPIYTQIIDEVRRALVVGTLRPDDAMPSVRQLAVELRVNPNTVSQAYRQLEQEGVVTVRRGQGTFVSSRANGAQREGLVQAVARRALRDAYRHGLSPDALVAAIRTAVREEAS